MFSLKLSLSVNTLESHKENGNKVPSSQLNTFHSGESHKENGNCARVGTPFRETAESHKENGNQVYELHNPAAPTL